MSTDLSHERLEEMIAADVLDGLDEPERLELEATLAEHGPDCDGCRRILTEYTAVAGSLAFALAPEPYSAGAEDRLIEAARAADASPDGRAAPVAVVPEPAGDAHVVRRTRRWLVAAAVAACFAVAGGLFGYSIAPRAPAGTAEFLAFVGRPHTRIVAFDASAPSSLAVAYRAGDRHAWIVGSGLKKPTGGHTYELWFRTSPDAPMQPAGVFLPIHGTVVAPVTIGQPVQALAVSVEPPGGSSHPTTTPIFVVTV